MPLPGRQMKEPSSLFNHPLLPERFRTSSGLPSPPSVLPVNPPEAISSKHQEETDPDTETTAVLAMFPSPLKLQPPSSERHEDMSIQPSSTLGEPFVNPITTAAESSSSFSSFSILHAAS